MSKSIMICGTGSHAGKSVLAAGLCRILKQDGFKPAPFKSQNMALNSFVTEDGAEMGRAQVTQAEACGLKPHVDMNPILLKPGSDTGAQVIVMGKPIGNMEARDYDSYKAKIFETAKQAFKRLSAQYDVIVMEGAGSPAEINLKDDIVNIKMAAAAGAPVIIVGDIDLGGVFAWLYGTVELLSAEQRKLIKGFIINKFRGNFEILKPGLKMIEERTGIPVLGVMPYIPDLQIDEEDSVACSRFSSPAFKSRCQSPKIKIEVLYLPHISNFTDFNPLDQHAWVELRYVRPGDKLSDPDVIIIPGTKNTINDLKFLYDNGYADQITALAAQGVFVIGICGGYQMLGQTISDPQSRESSQGQIHGLGLLMIKTVFEPGKITSQVKAVSTDTLKFFDSDQEITGYEIHMGQSQYLDSAEPLFQVERIIKTTKRGICRAVDGAVNKDNNVWGTYMHGIFDNKEFTNSFLKFAAGKRNILLEQLPEGAAVEFDPDLEFNRLANIMRDHIDLEKLYEIIGF